jgi:hypothetical protein
MPASVRTKPAQVPSVATACCLSIPGVAGPGVLSTGVTTRIGSFCVSMNAPPRPAQHGSGELDDEVQLPLRMRYLSLDGRAHMQHIYVGDRTHDVLYIPVWQNWRHEDGVGLAHFVGPPPADAVLMTADGDGAGPIRPLGDGWWWVE